MSESEATVSSMAVSVENVGGIDQTTVTLAPGVTVLTGRNATNRTSLLLSIMAALGHETTALKGDADEGRVELTIDDETYTRTLTRQDGGVQTGGDPYLSDTRAASNFAFLLERNDARRAVERGDDLREIIMEPVDTAEIERQIEQYQTEKRDIDDELAALDDSEATRRDLETERAELDEAIESTRAELQSARAELEAADGDLDESRAEKEALETTLSELEATRSELEETRYALETERESLDSLESERASLNAELDDLQDVDDDAVADLDARIDRLRAQKKEVEATLGRLKSVVQFNEETIEGEEGVVTRLLDEDDADGDGERADGDDGTVTDQLVDEDDETVTCWTCGSTVETAQLEATLERLRTVRAETFQRRSEIEAQIEELEAEREEYRNRRDRREEIETRIQRLDDEIDERSAQIESLNERRDALVDEIETLEAEAEAMRDESYAEILDLHATVNELELRLERQQDDRADIDDQIADIDDRLAEREALNERREEITAELESLRTRVDRLETEAVEAFNTHMQNVLETLAYGNIERIWIDRTEQTVREGRSNVSKHVFELHVVRTTESGATYEDTVDHLSESEREITGLVFALAGYLVHDVAETVPFLLLDSLEAIDSERIAAFVEYIQSHASNVVVALLPEDAEPLPESYHYVTDI